MVKQIEIMQLREKEIGKLLEYISKKSEGFTKPKIITIGGYALRGHMPFSRYTRDCDFVLKKKNGWHLDSIKNWFKDANLEAFHKDNSYGFLRFIKFLKVNRKTAKISLDFMEGEVRGRIKEAVVLIDDSFVQNSKKVKILVGEKEIDIFVPSYADYLIMKIVSGRRSDVRDIAALIWKNKIPIDIKKRAKEVLPYPEILIENIEQIIIPDISDERFINSWRGTFMTIDFTEDIKEEVLERLQDFLR